VVKAVEKANEYQKNIIFNKMAVHFRNNFKNRTIGVWGLSFKPKTDDIRESSSINLIGNLLKAGAKVKAYDPAAMEETKRVLGNKIVYSSDPYEALEAADAMVLMTEWSEFHLPDFRKMASLMKEKAIFDGRNIYDPASIKKMGFKYYGIGRR